MSGAGASARPGAAVGAPSGARARDARGRGSMRLIETTVLLLVGLLLAIATAHDVVLQTRVHHRLIADLRTWRAYTGHNYHDLLIGQDIHGHSTREVICGNTTPGGLKQRVQLCLVMSGAVSHGRRAVRSGWYLPPNHEDLRQYRYGCFGLAEEEERCPS
jgi:hypothetical protein